MAKIKNSPKVLGLDISTKTIGWALFDIQSQQLLELTHVSPRPKMKEDEKLKEVLTFFNDETGAGKIYISYPMVESIKHIPESKQAKVPPSAS